MEDVHELNSSLGTIFTPDLLSQPRCLLLHDPIRRYTHHTISDATRKEGGGLTAFLESRGEILDGQSIDANSCSQLLHARSPEVPANDHQLNSRMMMM